jgi:hypothetical protein
VLFHLQVDHHSFESIVYTQPIIGWFLERVFRRITTFQIIDMTDYVARSWPTVEKKLRHWVPGLDSRWDNVAEKARSVWWKPSIKFTGARETAPYSPEL